MFISHDNVISSHTQAASIAAALLPHVVELEDTVISPTGMGGCHSVTSNNLLDWPSNILEIHREDLRKSGIDAHTAIKMGIRSMLGTEIYRLVYGKGTADGKWTRCNGYCVPYFDENGRVVLNRCRLFWDPQDEDKSKDNKLPKYMSPQEAKTQLYIPPGFQAVYAATDYLIVTEGEKKAAKAVQEGFPCVAISGVDMWADSDVRRLENNNYVKMSYSTKLLKRLDELAKKRKTIVVFDSDAEKKPQINDSRRRLKDALLFQATHWCRMLAMPVPKGKENQKWGIDDLLVEGGGRDLFEKAVKGALTLGSQLMTPLFEFPYDRRNGEVYSYFVPNYGRYQDCYMSGVFKEVPPEEDGKEPDVKEVCSTRLWLSRVVHSVDGDGDTLYELTYVPHSEWMPRTITGDAQLISISNSKDDILARKGAKVLQRFKASLEEFLVDCQKYGVKEGKVKKAWGTRRRGWREADEPLNYPAYVMASRIITQQKTFAADDPNNNLIPIDSGSDEILRGALTVAGDAGLWQKAIEHHVLTSTVPTLVLSAGFAGLLRHWCPSSENFILHIYGESSAGKTTAMKVAASAWGNPKRLIDTWKATSNGLERRAVGRNDMVMFLDEAGMAEESELVAAIYAIGNGGEKGRATKDLRERATSKYNIVALSTGEKQLVRDAKFAGQEVRALEIKVDAAGPLWKTIHNAQEAEDFSRILDENYGHAIEPMIRGILSMVARDKKSVQQLWARRTDDIRSMVQEKLPQHMLRRIKHFGLCLTGLELFLRHVLEWSEPNIEDLLVALSDVIVQRLVSLDTDQFQEGEQIGMMRHFVNQVGVLQGKFAVEGKQGPVPLDLYGSIEGSMVFCIPSKLSEMMKPYDKARLIQAVEACNALITREHGRRKTITHRIGSARPDCYVFDMDKIDDVLNKNE